MILNIYRKPHCSRSFCKCPFSDCLVFLAPTVVSGALHFLFCFVVGVFCARKQSSAARCIRTIGGHVEAAWAAAQMGVLSTRPLITTWVWA